MCIKINKFHLLIVLKMYVILRSGPFKFCEVNYHKVRPLRVKTETILDSQTLTCQ